MNTLLYNKLHNYIYNTEDAIANFELGLEYRLQGQRAASISYLLRAAEITDDVDLTYTCILLNYLNLYEQPDRKHSAKGQLLHAVALQPQRAEAYYFLSTFHEGMKEWQESYSMACIAETLPTGKSYVDLGYPGAYAATIQKAVAGWHVGYCEESKDLFRHLLVTYKMLPHFHKVVVDNLEKLINN